MAPAITAGQVREWIGFARLACGRRNGSAPTPSGSWPICWPTWLNWRTAGTAANGSGRRAAGMIGAAYRLLIARSCDQPIK
jgi:hypothetical protein